jgi:hypothetical protein
MHKTIYKPPFVHYAPVFFDNPNDTRLPTKVAFIAEKLAVLPEVESHRKEWRRVWKRAADFWDKPDAWMQRHFGDRFDGAWSPAARAARAKFGIRYGKLLIGRLWAMTSQDFVCPCCGRTKAEMYEPTKQDGRWQGRLVIHHDHATDFGEPARFPRTIVCDGDNTIESGCKSGILRDPAVRKGFTWSPNEIRKFIDVAPNRKHLYDRKKALAIFEARMAGVPCDDYHPQHVRDAKEPVNGHYMASEQELFARINALVPGLAPWETRIFAAVWLDRGCEDGTMQHKWVLHERAKLRARQEAWKARPLTVPQPFRMPPPPKKVVPTPMFAKAQFRRPGTTSGGGQGGNASAA